MSSSMKDKIKGTFHEVKGQVKKTTGKLIKNTELEAEGTGEKIAGQTQHKAGQVKKVFDENRNLGSISLDRSSNRRWNIPGSRNRPEIMRSVSTGITTVRLPG